MIDEAVLTAIREDVQAKLTTFSTTFTKAYKDNLVSMKLEDPEEEAEPEERQLDDEKESEEPEILHSGWATKRGAVVKNWKKRYFEVRAESFTYYEKQGGSAKGEFTFGGYKLIRDPNAHKMSIKSGIYSELGVSTPIEDYTKYEPFTLELYNAYRRRFLLKLENEADYKVWADVLEKCCDNADGRKCVDDEVCVSAYDTAFDETRADMNVISVMTFGGTEEDRLTDLLMEHVKNRHLASVFSSLNAPAVSMKVTMRGKILDVVRGIVNGSVVTMWKGLKASTDKMRPTVEGALDKVTTPVREAQSSLTEKAKEKTLDTIRPVQEKALQPIAAFLAKLVLPSTTKSFASIEGIFKERTDAYIKSCEGKVGNLDANFANLKCESRYISVMHPSFDCLSNLLEPFSAIVSKVPGVGDDISGVIDKLSGIVSLKSYVYETQDSLSNITKKAFLTFKEDTKKIASAGKDMSDAATEAQKNTLEKLRHDARLDVIARIGAFLTNGVGSLVKDKLAGVCSPLIEPLESLIPDVARDFLSISKILDGVLDGVTGDVVSKTVGAVSGDIKF